MRITQIEIQNFRKLKAVGIAFDDKSTLLVGANNSGKTSAMTALRLFLVAPSQFSTNDITLSNWDQIAAIGKKWMEADAAAPVPNVEDWSPLVPSLDLWLHVEANELHHVRDLIPRLDWFGPLIGVRLRFEPKDTESLFKDYCEAAKAAAETRQVARTRATDGTGTPNALIWPEDLRSYLDKKLNAAFAVKAYILDPSKYAPSTDDQITPQDLPKGLEPIESNPLKGLLRIDFISAQRLFGEESPSASTDEADPGAKESRGLSTQLRSYYARHLDLSEIPEPEDLDALLAIEGAERKFDERLAVGFSSAIKELGDLNYPGLTDPRLKIGTKLRPTDGLKHNAAVQYDLLPADGATGGPSVTLPEQYNGLGYQNLISMAFRLMGFRDAWMRVGKAGKDPAVAQIEPLHLVLVEEPEAHLHCQVQQVFVKKAYDILRNHEQLKENKLFRTQLVISTHSSYVVHQCDFGTLRYFRREPASVSCCVPSSVVINLSTVFGQADETTAFVKRYLKTTHCDLFFADAAIFIEGAAEKILLPHFIDTRFPILSRCYVSLLEIGGNHAHRLRPLVERLGLTTLIITDLDAVEGDGHHSSVCPASGAKQITANATFKEWHPKQSSIDKLLTIGNDDKVKAYDKPSFAIRVAFQQMVRVSVAGDNNLVELPATTFEHALVLENLALFRTQTFPDSMAPIVNAIKSSDEGLVISKQLYDVIRKKAIDKAGFALDVLLKCDPGQLRVPQYIADGLEWLQSQLTPNSASKLTGPVATRTT